MKKYLAFDGINYEYEQFDTLEESQDWLKKGFLGEEGYHPDLKDCAIYKLVQKVDYDITDRKSDHSEEEWEEITVDTDFEELWQHKFIDVEFRKYVNALPSETDLDNKINDILNSQCCASKSNKSQYFKGYKACYNWIHRIVEKLD